MLIYDEYKANNFEADHWDVSVEEFNGIISWDCSGGQAYFLNEENNNIIPKRYRNKEGAYYNNDQRIVWYYLGDEDHEKEKKELDLAHLLNKKRRSLEASRAVEIAKIKGEIAAELEIYKTRAIKKIRPSF